MRFFWVLSSPANGDGPEVIVPQPCSALAFPADDAELMLPLSAGTARALTLQQLGALPADMNRLLRHDPALLAWCRLQVPANSSFEQLAGWLLTETGQQQWLCQVRELATDEVSAARIVELARRSLTAASNVHVGDDGAVMAALLHNWPEWACVMAQEPAVRRAAGDLTSQVVPDQPLPPAEDGITRDPPEVQLLLDASWLVDPQWHRALLHTSRLIQARAQAPPTYGERLEQEKLASLKELAYGASHEINNPLANIATRAQTLMADEPDPQRRRTLAMINQQAFRAHEMIADMMLFAKPPQLELGPVDVADMLQRVVHGLDPMTRSEQVRIILNVAAGCSIEADQVQLEVAIRAICQNALEAMPTGGVVTIAARLYQDEQSTAHIEITIRDDGPGIADQLRPHIFDPFFSGREAGRGLGFGLSKAWRIVTEHQGQLQVSSPPTGGCTFVVRLPQQPPNATERLAGSTGAV